VTTGKELRAFIKPGSHGWSFFPDSEYVVSGSLDGVMAGWDEEAPGVALPGPLFVWEVKTGKVVRTFDEGSRGTTALAVSPDGKCVVARRREKETLELWDARTGKLLHDLGIKGWPLGFSPDGKVLHAGVYVEATLPDLKLIRSVYAASFEVASGEMTTHFELKDTGEGILAFSPDGKFAIRVRWDSDLRQEFYLILWDVLGGKEVRRFETRQGEKSATSANAKAMSFTPDGKHVVMVNADGMMWRWDVGTGKLVWAVEVAPFGVREAALSADCRRAFTGSNNPSRGREVHQKLWDAGTGKLERTLTGPK
jgi:WD40 repeat protein